MFTKLDAFNVYFLNKILVFKSLRHEFTFFLNKKHNITLQNYHMNAKTNH